MVNYYASLAPVNESFTLKDGSQTLQVKKATNQNPFAFANSVVTVIVSDAKFNELAQKYPNASYAIVSFDGKNMRDNEKLVQAFKKTKVAYFSSYERNKLITNANSPTFLMISNDLDPIFCNDQHDLILYCADRRIVLKRRI